MHTEVRDGGLIHVRLSGDWNFGSNIPEADDLLKPVKAGSKIMKVTFDTEGITDWDSSLLTFLTKVFDQCSEKSIEVDEESLPEGVQRLLKLATAVPERKGARREAKRDPFLHRVADSAISLKHSSQEMLDFLGEATLASFRFLRGKAQYRRSDFWMVIQEVGVQALPIVSLISLLVGLILAFVGAVQLMMFGAQIYVASLVGIAMTRVMGAIMAGIIMSGRTGASFAAQLGTMQVNEEIDALKTMGISPMEFLVLPRMFALALMMPLLCIYADLMGMLGGLIVGVTMLDLNFMEYYNTTVQTVSLTHFWVGLVHGFVFGILVALAGCLRGMQCGRSATAVGFATTSAVVTGIVAIIVSTAIITVLCNILGI
jgi:phospholipid/cholesterol/gamma-HCH transport system permease protein